MKLSHQQLPQHLKQQTLAPIYFLSGDELFLVEQAMQAIILHAQHMGFANIIRLTNDISFTWDHFTQATQNLSLFSEKSLVVCRLNSWKLDATAKNALQHYVSHKSPFYCAIITGPKLEAATSKTKWFSQLEQGGCHLPIWPVDFQQLPQWILQRGKHYQLNLTSNQAGTLATLVEGNLLAADQELEKLSLLGDTVTDDMLAAVTSDNAHYDIFTLVDCCLAGDSKRGLKMLTNLQHTTEAILVQWALAREMRNMHSVLGELSQGAALRQISRKYQIWDKRLAPVQQFIKTHDQPFCQRQLQRLAEVDKCIKGMCNKDPWLGLQQVCMAVAGCDVSFA